MSGLIFLGIFGVSITVLGLLASYIVDKIEDERRHNS